MSQYLYLLLNLGSISIPLFYSVFEKKFHFIQHLKISTLSIVQVAIPFIIWDAFFTANGIWGFNPTYHLPLTILGMPISEWLFFLCIPYACLFTSEVLKYLFPGFKITQSLVYAISALCLGMAFVLLLLNFGKLYTTFNFMVFIILLTFCLVKHPETLQYYYPAFLVILIPFLIVNGILTGSLIDAPVVWYNNQENMGFRILTIPFEDVFYAFNLLLPTQLIFNFLNKNQAKKSTKL